MVLRVNICRLVKSVDFVQIYTDFITRFGHSMYQRTKLKCLTSYISLLNLFQIIEKIFTFILQILMYVLSLIFREQFSN